MPLLVKLFLRCLTKAHSEVLSLPVTYSQSMGRIWLSSMERYMTTWGLPIIFLRREVSRFWWSTMWKQSCECSLRNSMVHPPTPAVYHLIKVRDHVEETEGGRHVFLLLFQEWCLTRHTLYSGGECLHILYVPSYSISGCWSNQGSLWVGGIQFKLSSILNAILV